MKLFLRRLDLKPGHPQLRIISSSASIESDDEKSRKFLDDFFGKNCDFNIICGEKEQVTEIEGDKHLNPVPFTKLIESNRLPKEDEMIDFALFLTLILILTTV